MPCHNQQLNTVNSGQEHPMKQVRFANSSSVPAVPTSEPSDATIQPGSQENLGPQLKLLPLNDQIRELQTIIRDRWVPTVLSSNIHITHLNSKSVWQVLGCLWLNCSSVICIQTCRCCHRGLKLNGDGWVEEANTAHRLKEAQNTVSFIWHH